MNKKSTEKLYEPFRKHPDLFGATFHHDWLHPDMKLLVEGISTEPDLSKLPLQVETKDVYSFDCFNETFLTMFNEELDHFYETAAAWNIPVRRPNSMNNYGVIVNEIGMRPMITDFQQNYLWPISKRLFPRDGEQFDDHHAFIVRYHSDEDLGLDMHTDDSDVTFNVCLGHAFTGATLQFCGTMGTPKHRQQSHTYHHKVGRAVVHLGSRRHGADDIESGTRANLIVWSLNHKWRSSPEYKRRLSVLYEPESGPPDPVCLSYTHDRDYAAYKKLPEAAKGRHYHPWCPPPGLEYEGYEEIWDSHSEREKEENGL